MRHSNSISSLPHKLSRRRFLKASTLAVLGAPFVLRSAHGADKRLNLACIGLGGQGTGDLKAALECGVNVVALCDVDERQLAGVRQSVGAALANARDFTDYRKLFEQAKTFDAVLIATPDHWHAPLCTAALRAGKHVYCEKPLTHNIAEARALGELARRSKVATQTGNQGAASGGFRRSLELIRAGVLGAVSEVHVWHPAHGWPSGVDRPAGEDSIPAGFNWDFWIGKSPVRPYKTSIYHPVQWRGWYDFGNGSIGDFCCHGFQLPVRALKLDSPTRIEIAGTGLGKESFAKSCRVRYHFPARLDRGAVALTFWSGGEMPAAEVTASMAESFGKVPDTGCLLVGERGSISAGLWNSDCYLKMKDEPKFRGGDNHEAGKSVPQSLPRTPGHMREWVDACLGGPPTFSNFEIGAHLTEIGLIGSVALQLGHDIEWDGPRMRVKGVPGAAALIKPPARTRWLR